MNNEIANNRKIMNVACATDNNFSQHVCVMLYSLMGNLKGDYFVNIYILDSGINLDNKNRILKSLDIFKNNSSIFFINIDINEFSKFTKTKLVSRDTYSRIALPDLLPNVDKIIYLDADLVVLGSIAELFERDIGNSYIMAVKDSSLGMNNIYEKKLKIPNKIGYFNAGVMLMDLSKFRKYSISEKIYDFLNKIDPNLYHNDQSGLNRILFDNWRPLNPSWNQLAEIDFYRSYKFTTYSREEFDSAKKSPKIIHYSGKVSKPWLYENVGSNGKYYFEYLSKTEFRDFKIEVKPSRIILKILYYIYYRIIPTRIAILIYNIFNEIRIKFNNK